MMLIAIHNVDVFMIEETQCSGNGFPCMAESQVGFSTEKIVPLLVETFNGHLTQPWSCSTGPGDINIFTSLFCLPFQFYCIELKKREI